MYRAIYQLLMAKGKFQVNMVGSEDTPVEKEREIFSRILDTLLKKPEPEKLTSPELSNNQGTHDQI